MKKILLSCLCVFLLSQGKTQLQMYGGMEDMYRNFMVQAHSQQNKLFLQDFMGAGGDNRFYSNYWENGGATNNFGVTIAEGYLFNYDFLGQELHAKWKDTTIVVNTNYVKRFYLMKGGSTHMFVKSAELDPQQKYFYESLAFDADTNDSGKVQLLKLRTVKRVKANKDYYLANATGDYSDKMDNDVHYFVVLPDKTYTKVKLNKKAILSALGKYKEKADTYFKSVDKVNEETCAGMVRYLNKE